MLRQLQQSVLYRVSSPAHAQSQQHDLESSDIAQNTEQVLLQSGITFAISNIACAQHGHLFLHIGWNDVSELRPSKGLLFFSHVMYEYGDHVELYWQGKPKNSEKSLSQYNFLHHKSDMNRPEPPLREAAAYHMAWPVCPLTCQNTYSIFLSCLIASTSLWPYPFIYCM
jgi:hypothetical protein